jgi:hypothetical protein
VGALYVPSWASHFFCPTMSVEWRIRPI